MNIWILISIFIAFLLIVFFTNKIMHLKSFLLSYDKVQSTHSHLVLSAGGIPIYLGVLVYCFYYPNQYLSLNSLILFCPFFFLSVWDDIIKNVKPKLRLLIMFITSIIIVYYNNNFPKIEIPILKELFEYELFVLCFFSLSITGLLTGSNFIDGLNGLASFTIIGQAVSFFLIARYLEDIYLTNISIIIISIMLIFLIFNFPFGYIFLGDSGIYVLALLSALININIFYFHDHLPSWLAVVIVIYPVTECIFSMLRKILFQQSPFKPDNRHLHILIYRFISNKKIFYSKKLNNSFTSIILSPFYISTPIIVLFFLENKIIFFLYIYIIFFILCYSIFYIIFSNLVKK